MGTIQDKFKSKRDIVIALLGLDGAGKSTLMQSLTEDESDEDEEPLATIGYSTRTLSVGRYNVTMTEVGGGNDIRGIWPKYFAQCYGLIYMVDGSSNRNRIDESRRELRNILLDPRMKCKPLLVLCNKADLPNTMGADELINAFSLHEMLQESVNNGLPVSIEPKVRVWICSCLKVKGSGKRDRRLMLSLKWLLKQITMDWEELSARVSEQHGLELEEKERERQERIKERRRRREEAERLERESAAAVVDEPMKQEITVIAEVQDHSLNDTTINDIPLPTVPLIDDINSNHLISMANQPQSTPTHNVPDDKQENRIKTTGRVIIRRLRKRHKLTPRDNDNASVPSPWLLPPPIQSSPSLLPSQDQQQPETEEVDFSDDHNNHIVNTTSSNTLQQANNNLPTHSDMQLPVLSNQNDPISVCFNLPQNVLLNRIKQ